MNNLDSILRKYIISASQLNEQNIYLESQSEEFLNRLYQVLQSMNDSAPQWVSEEVLY